MESSPEGHLASAYIRINAPQPAYASMESPLTGFSIDTSPCWIA